MTLRGNQHTVPYVPFSTFLRVLDFLKVSALSTQLTREDCGDISEATWDQLRRTLRFLGLLNGCDEPNSSLRRLVRSRDRKPLLHTLLRKHYSDLFDLGLAHTNVARVNRVFAIRGVTRTTVGRARSFFIAAARYSGVELSNSLLKVARHRISPRANQKRSLTENNRPPKLRKPQFRSSGKVALTISFDLSELRRSERLRIYELLDEVVSLSQKTALFAVTDPKNTDQSSMEPDEQHVH